MHARRGGWQRGGLCSWLDARITRGRAARKARRSRGGHSRRHTCRMRARLCGGFLCGLHRWRHAGVARRAACRMARGRNERRVSGWCRGGELKCNVELRQQRCGKCGRRVGAHIALEARHVAEGHQVRRVGDGSGDVDGRGGDVRCVPASHEDCRVVEEVLLVGRGRARRTLNSCTAARARPTRDADPRTSGPS